MSFKTEPALFSRYWPLLAVVLLFLLLQGLAVRDVLSVTSGELCYTLDDSFIHMAMAKNLAFHGVWGVTRDAFTWSSSSPLWTGLLAAGYRILGEPVIWLPLLFGILSMIGLLAVVDWLLRKHEAGSVRRLLGLCVLLFVMPVALQVLSGLEHILQSLLTLIFVYLASVILSEPAVENRTKLQNGLLALTPLVVLVRYEGLLVVFVVCALLLIRRRVKPALLLGALAWGSVLLPGLIALYNGWSIFPNSILLKSAITKPLMSTSKGMAGFAEDYDLSRYLLVLLIPVVTILFIWLNALAKKTFWDRRTVFAVILCGITDLHLCVAQVGWLFRYELYLVVLLVYLLADIRYADLETALNQVSRTLRLAVLTLSLLLIIGLISTGLFRASQYRLATLAARNIHEQQVQTGKFLAANYQRASVLANDVGAINYYADIHCIDFQGLTNRKAGQWRLHDEWTTNSLDRLAKEEHAQIAVVYTAWLDTIPDDWYCVGTWQITNNRVCGSDKVAFYAIGKTEVQPILNALRSFALRLPRSVKQSGIYCDNSSH